MEHRCGCPENYATRALAASAEATLPTKRPLYIIRQAPPGLTVDVIAAWYEKAFQRWTKVADIRTRRIHDLAEAQPGDVVNWIDVADLGTSGVLADQELPHANAKFLRMRLNTRITWNPTDGPMSNGIDPVRVLAHEQGHFLGHQHWPQGAPPELMEPVIRNDVIGPQPTEAKVTAGWFGLPVGNDPPTPPEPPAPPIPSPCSLLDKALKARTAIRAAARSQKELVMSQEVVEKLKKDAALPCANLFGALDRICPRSSAYAQAAINACSLIQLLLEAVPKLCPPQQQQ